MGQPAHPGTSCAAYAQVAPDGEFVLHSDYAAVVAERDALQDELRKLMETANYNAALSISELRESMHVPKDEPIRGRCANCGEWHPVRDMWAECTPCFDETVAKQAKAERDALARDMQGVRAATAWANARPNRRIQCDDVDACAMEWTARADDYVTLFSADSLPALGLALIQGGHVDAE
jgi:hypothetical protein